MIGGTGLAFELIGLVTAIFMSIPSGAEGR